MLHRRSLLLPCVLTIAIFGSTNGGCSCGDDGGTDAGRADAGSPIIDGGFVCIHEAAEACIGDVHYSCVRDGEFLRSMAEDCRATGEICVPDLWCVVCRPGEIGCQDGDAVQCRDDGSGWDVIEDCDTALGLACIEGTCQNLCDIAVRERSYVGCEFFAADLDNAGIAVGRDASAQQYAIVVSNPGQTATEVQVEINEAPFGETPRTVVIDSTTVLPGDLEVFELPRREVDGSSSNSACTPTDRTCPGSEVCLCSMADTVAPCFCRRTATSSGINDGTHSAVTSHGFRVRSSLPIIAYQFNPLDNVGVFSNDASLLLPVSAMGDRYTIVSWPQTIADGEGDMDFDSGSDDEDLRAFLTVVGTSANTNVRITLGSRVRYVLGIDPAMPVLREGNTVELNIGPFDVINLETQGLNADFTGSLVESSSPVAVFVGGEASDVPRFETYATRQCCADHLEEQAFPDQSLGRAFIIARMPPRTKALNAAFLDPTRDSVAEVNEPEWVRVTAVSAGLTEVSTTLPAPDNFIMLGERESIIFRADQDFMMWSNNPIAVLQALPSQEAVGIPSEYPGGDPAIIMVPPLEQYRQDYVFLTPDKYAFDFVTIMAPRTANILLDGAPLNPAVCTTSAADGLVRRMGEPPPDDVIHRCQLSFPDVIGLPNVRVEEGVQADGVHTLVADRPIAVIAYGFDAYVSYAYAGGLNLQALPR